MLGVQDPLRGPHQPLGHQAILEADHHLLDAIHVVPEVDDTIDLSELLEELFDDDELLPGEGKVPRLDQDLVGHRIRAKVPEVEALEGVDLAIRDGENLVEDIIGIFGSLEVDKPEVASSMIEDVGDNSKVREGVDDHLLLD